MWTEVGNKSGLPEREQELEERPRARRWVTAGKGAMDEQWTEWWRQGRGKVRRDGQRSSVRRRPEKCCKGKILLHHRGSDRLRRRGIRDG